MMLRLTLALSFLLLALGAARAQGTAPLTISFRPEYAGHTLKLETPLPHPDGRDSLEIHGFRCYISGLTLLRDGNAVWTEPGGYHLIDASVPASLQLRVQVPGGLRYDALRFHSGVDSAINARGAQGGDLDPVRGMYWAWQSGYINMKLEGRSARCTTRRNEFQYHLGGFRGTDNALQTVTLPLTPGPEAAVRIELAAFLAQLDLAAAPQLMIPGPEAVRLSKLAASMFKTGAQP